MDELSSFRGRFFLGRGASLGEGPYLLMDDVLVGIPFPTVTQVMDEDGLQRNPLESGSDSPAPTPSNPVPLS